MMWVFWACGAASLDAISDTISDEVVGDQGEHLPPAKQNQSAHDKLSGEQDVIVSCILAAVLGAILLLNCGEEIVFDMQSNGFLIALASGGVYLAAILCVMKAFETLPSTVLVPLLQMTTPLVEIIGWVLSPFHAYHPVLAPFETSAMNQRDVLSFFIIFAGSCLPWFPTKASAQNDLFECKRDVLGAGVKYGIGSAIAYALHTMMISCATSPTMGPQHMISTAQFVGWSNISAFVVVACLVFAEPSFRRGFLNLRLYSGPRHSKKIIGLCAISEVSNFFAVLVFSISISMYPNEGVVEASRMGLVQIENFIFTIVLYKLFRFGRRPDRIAVKFLSCVLVCSGLYHSAATA